MEGQEETEGKEESRERIEPKRRRRYAAGEAEGRREEEKKRGTGGGAESALNLETQPDERQVGIFIYFWSV